MSSSTLFPVYHIGRLLFHQSTMRNDATSLQIIETVAFDKGFYTCDVAVVKSLYITFLIYKEQFAFQVR